MPLLSLPDDVVLEIFSHLRTARDVAHVSETCTRLADLAHRAGWRGFVRGGFGSLALGEACDGRWDLIAERLTRQSRCFERRCFLPVAYIPSGPVRDHENQGQGHGQGRGRGRLRHQDHRSLQEQHRQGNFFSGYTDNSHPFSPVIDSCLTHQGSFELVAWGAGEDIVGRFRNVQGRQTDDGTGDAWFRMEGGQTGFQPVKDDVTAIKLVEPEGNLGMLIGRASGGLQLISAERENAGQVVTSFDLPVPSVDIKAASWGTVSSLDIFPNGQSMLGGTRATIGLFPLTAPTSPSAGACSPTDTYTFTNDAGQPLFIHAAKALTNDIIVCGLGTDDSPLRWLTRTPTGLTTLDTGKDPRLSRSLAPGCPQTTARALEAVYPGYSYGSGSAGGYAWSFTLLLSGWDDGSIRLLDPRTPSPADILYRDVFQPQETISSLLSYGSHRFIAGSNEYPHLKVFDFRWTSNQFHSYSYTDARPCSAALPFPGPSEKPAIPLDLEYGDTPACRAGGEQCAFHSASRGDSFNEDVSIIFHGGDLSSARTRPARIHALTKSSDAAESFYVGLPGAVAEMRATEATELSPAVRRAASRRGWRAEPGKYSFLETGVGKTCSVGSDRPSPDLDLLVGWQKIPAYVPRLATSRNEIRDWKTPGAERHRWDERFWERAHFQSKY